MAEPRRKRWDELKERILSTPELRAAYESDKHEYVMTRKMLMAIDEERQRAGLSKAELARRIGKAPAAVRRVFTSQTSNPTLGTVLRMAGMLGLEIDFVRPARTEPGSTAPRKRHTRPGGIAV